MDRREFNIAVLRSLPRTVYPKDMEVIKVCIDNLYRSKFTIEDAKKYVRCLEEVSPSLEESKALAIMEKLWNKYKKGT